MVVLTSPLGGSWEIPEEAVPLMRAVWRHDPDACLCAAEPDYIDECGYTLSVKPGYFGKLVEGVTDPEVLSLFDQDIGECGLGLEHYCDLPYGIRVYVVMDFGRDTLAAMTRLAEDFPGNGRGGPPPPRRRARGRVIDLG